MPSFGTLKADTLTHSTAGSLATNFVVNGSAKCFAGIENGATGIYSDSLNVSSVTDNATGQYNITVTNTMVNSLGETGIGARTNGDDGDKLKMNPASSTTSQFHMRLTNAGGNTLEDGGANVLSLGDLA
jgi:hypothetical protein